jgi:hypothetical protein
MHVSSRSVTPSPFVSTTLNGAAHSQLQPSSILRQFVASGRLTVAVEPRHDDCPRSVRELVDFGPKSRKIWTFGG